ncbi:S1C family serine protease [Pseudalkalibacillus salsuginis]|uniref:S1C family serine protease n=1 Tax=Pseudalkalibacillus salsuginis TaxID=2910972 RepID=UPI001F28D500|nr:trypsin-like peptidase domain-containing protein [Pseudalkalibacillus salsuginis]MCF6410832.1 S1C family serine protease [Pseudalkalibacillus salsuginis]
MKRRAILSIIITSLIVIAGIFGGYSLHNHFSSLKVSATSSIGEVNAETETIESPKEKDLKTIIHESEKSVVQLEVAQDGGESLGSGFIYNENGDVVTNAHVVKGGKSILVRTANAQQYEGQLIGIGESTDIAVIRVPELAGEQPLKIAEAHEAEIGDEVVALGSPLGLQNTVTTGIISGLNREFTIDDYTYSGVYQISAPIAKGNSGGPLIDKQTGQVLAINSAGTEEGSIGFSIPLSDVYKKIVSWSKNPDEHPMEPGDNLGHTSDLTLDARESEYLVGYFFGNLTIGDYVTAYSLLGSKWQTSTPYKKFREGYLHTIDITINKISSEPAEEEDKIIVTVIIEALERNKNKNTETVLYKCSYEVGFENNQPKLLSGKAEEIE